MELCCTATMWLAPQNEPLHTAFFCAMQEASEHRAHSRRLRASGGRRTAGGSG